MIFLEPVHFGHVMAYRVFLKHILNLFQLEKESNFGIWQRGFIHFNELKWDA